MQYILELMREAGYPAACSALGPARNDASSVFWLYRDVQSEGMDSLGDRYRCSPLARRSPSASSDAYATSSPRADPPHVALPTPRPAARRCGTMEGDRSGVSGTSEK